MRGTYRGVLFCVVLALFVYFNSFYVWGIGTIESLENYQPVFTEKEFQDCKSEDSFTKLDNDYDNESIYESNNDSISQSGYNYDNESVYESNNDSIAQFGDGYNNEQFYSNGEYTNGPIIQSDEEYQNGPSNQYTTEYYDTSFGQPTTEPAVQFNYESPEQSKNERENEPTEPTENILSGRLTTDPEDWQYVEGSEGPFVSKIGESVPNFEDASPTIDTKKDSKKDTKKDTKTAASDSMLQEIMEMISKALGEKSPSQNSSEPINPLASATLPAAISLFNFMKRNEGKKIISGQQEGRVDNKEEEFERIRNWTGKSPAIRGFDLLSYFQNVGSWNDGTIERAIDWGKNKNGIVAMTWHWPAPGNGDLESFYSRKSGFSLKKAIEEPNSWEAQMVNNDIDKAADLLLKLKNEGVPVLWRPLHEAEMGWFWWGREKDPTLTKALYYKMYNRFKERGLDNLIWVWANSDSNFYPGDQYVDVIGADAYWVWGDGLGEQTVQGVRNYATGHKMQAITENDKFPSSKYFKDWSWFMNWFGTNGNINSYDEVKQVYDNPDVITLEQLPKDLYSGYIK